MGISLEQTGRGWEFIVYLILFIQIGLYFLFYKFRVRQGDYFILVCWDLRGFSIESFTCRVYQGMFIFGVQYKCFLFYEYLRQLVFNSYFSIFFCLNFFVCVLGLFFLFLVFIFRFLEIYFLRFSRYNFFCRKVWLGDLDFFSVVSRGKVCIFLFFFYGLKYRIRCCELFLISQMRIIFRRWYVIRQKGFGFLGDFLEQSCFFGIICQFRFLYGGEISFLLCFGYCYLVLVIIVNQCFS